MFIFIFLHYLPAYQSEAIKVAAGLSFWLPAQDDFHSSKLANQTLGWPQLTLRQKRRQISSYELFSTQYIFTQYIIYCICKLSMYMVTFNSEQVVFCCNCMTKAELLLYSACTHLQNTNVWALCKHKKLYVHV